MTVIEVTERAYGSATHVRLPEQAEPYARPGIFWRRPGVLADGLTAADRRPPSCRGDQPPELVGRDKDVTVIRAFIDQVPARGGALLMSGEPGVGKTALLDAAARTAAADGIRVLRAAGAGFEDVSFSGLNQILLPLRGELDRLADPQRSALNVALGFSDGMSCDRLVVSNAALDMLRAAAADRPLLVIVDNLQWMDPASVLVLGFVARRLAGSRVGFLAAARTGEPGPIHLDVPGYEVLPLDDEESARLVVTRFPDLVPGVRQRVVTEALGNPLALLELPGALSDVQRSALAALPALLPLSRRLRALFGPRVRDLPAATGCLLLLAALEGTGNLSLLRAAAAGRWDVDDLAPAERAGLVHIDEHTGLLMFRHPLIRSAVVELSASNEVRRAHQALAAQLGGQPERQAWHQAAAAIEPDEEVASLLEQAASQAERRGDAIRAVTALLRAAQLSPRECDRSRLLARAACLSATVTAELPIVPRLLAEARRVALAPGSDGSLHAAVADACLLLNGADDIDMVHRLLVEAIGAWPGTSQTRDGALTAALRTLLMVCSAGGRPELWESFDAALTGLVPDVPAELDLLARVHADPARSAAGALGELDAAGRDLTGETDCWRIVILGAVAACTDRLADCRDALRQVAACDGRGGRRGGAVLPAIAALTLLCEDGFATGTWDEARQLAGECLQACESYGLPSRAWMVREHLAMIAAARGDEELVRELTGEMLRWAVPRGITLAQMAARRAGSLAALGRADFEEAYLEAAAISPPGILASHAPHALWAAMDLVEAAVRTGRRPEAAAHVAAIREARIAEISPRLALLATASAALAAPACQAGRLFEQALGIPGVARWPFEVARVQLAYGEHLRRARATCDARTHLGAALATFRALGARPWADRAANELRATRMTVVKTEAHRPPVLTAQEHQIASLAAAGLTNKQIGQRLYLSHRTVSAHLYRVFPKLGISTRAGLRDALVALSPA